MSISLLRKQYHNRVSEEIIRIRRNASKGDYPNFADGDSKASSMYAWGIVNQLDCAGHYEDIKGEVKGQTAGRRFESITCDFLRDAFQYLQHVRPGDWTYGLNTAIAEFAQYEHLEYIDRKFSEDPILEAAFGGDYVVEPDIVVARWPVSDEVINKLGILNDVSDSHARFTSLRVSNHEPLRQILHAIVSCKWTIRSDRAQNTRTEVLNLIRNRKGHLPHMVAVTAEPWPVRISALALGTGDLDCVYHFALPELVQAVRKAQSEDAQELLDVMINGKRLRDISDLPFDLAI